jgi:molecular chaperone HtpG
VLDLLEKMVKNEPDDYAAFWKEFGNVLKEGPGEDFTNRERIAKLLRFASTGNESEAQSVSLEDYIGRMKEGQKTIYYVTADSFAAASNSPHLQIFQRKGIEVLLLSDRVDEWLMSHLTEFDGKALVSIAKGELDLDALADENEKAAAKKVKGEFADVAERMQKVLEVQVREVRISQRLTDSPSCLVMEEQEMAVHLQHMLKQAGHAVPDSKPVLEINPEHLLVSRLKTEQDDTRFADWSYILFDQALLSEGGQLENPVVFVNRMNDFLSQMTK